MVKEIDRQRQRPMGEGERAGCWCETNIKREGILKDNNRMIDNQMPYVPSNTGNYQETA